MADTAADPIAAIPRTSSPVAVSDVGVPAADPVPVPVPAPAGPASQPEQTPPTPTLASTPASDAIVPAPASPVVASAVESQRTLSPPPRTVSRSGSPPSRNKSTHLPKTHTKPLPPTPQGSTSTSLSPDGNAAEKGPIPLTAPISAPLPAIDHLIHRCQSVADLRVAVKTFSALGFTVLEGGQHADGLTRNALIVFADGTYLEFVAFEDEPTNPDGTPKSGKHKRSVSSGSGPASWFASLRRERRPSTPSPVPHEKIAAAGRPSTEVARINEKEDAPSSVPTIETKEEFLARRAKHWWWNTEPKGWIDFCFTTGVAPARKRKDTLAEAKRGGPYRAPTLHRTAIVNANAANAASAALASASAGDEKPMPAIPRPMPEEGATFAPAGGQRSPADAVTDAEDLPPVSYDQPFELGRQTKDGKHLQFEVIFPRTARRRVPFFCEDITPRHLRVPPAASRHPNGSTGLSAVTLLYATPATFHQALDTLCPLLGVNTVNKVLHTHPAISSTTFDLRIRTPSSLTSSSSSSTSSSAGATAKKEEEGAMEGGAKPIPASLANIGRRGSGAGRPMSAEGDAADTSQDSHTSSHHTSPPQPQFHNIHTIPLHIRIAQDVQERAHVEQHGEGLYEVEIFVAADRLPENAPPDGIERTTAQLGYGRIRLHPIFVSMLPVQARVGLGVPGPAGGGVGAGTASGAAAAAAGPLKQTTI
ncbi:unnamed protein product [Tilletia controversa]|nr:hypothetical protein CF336_g2142 [Tilletia laevis]KAE8202952.1 hypothetical protein CF328_g1920 [Tilletia controversa]KAE8263254.1 hypothetical protein A4X03_0g1821 [Tilletia caries]CAD6915666.1 unnamed protein product [Tilletia laevis]CAD6922295.1 unnamed protein product [Tilletia caries]